MPRKSPANPSEALAGLPPALPAVRKVARRTKPALPVAGRKPFAPRPEPARRYGKKSSSAMIILVLAVLILLALGAYFASSYLQNKATEEAALKEQAAIAEQAANVTTTPAIPADPAANWPAFTLPASATSSAPLSFKYPAELQLTQNPDNLILSNDNVTSTQVNIYWVKSKKSLKDYLAALDKANATGWGGKPSVAIATSTESVVISGWPAVFRQQKLLAADLNQYITYIKASDTVYAVSLAAPQLDQNLLAFFVTFLNNFKLGQ